MAKMFYTLDETKVALGQSEDQIKQLTRDGRLREFRDGPRLMFKADQVDALKSQIAGGDGLTVEESGAPIGLAADTMGGTGAPLTLADSLGGGSVSSGSGLAGISGSGLGSGLSGGAPGSGLMNLKEDTALAADLGLSGTGLAGSLDSLGGIPSPSHSSGGSLSGLSNLSGLGGTAIGSGIAGSGIAGSGISGSGLGGSGMSGSGVSGTSGGTRGGVNVFGEESHFAVDPMAQTAAPGLGGPDLNLEGVGSGSGLLDLTRESDDTSLGAEILDDIGPGKGGGSRPLGPPDTGGSMVGLDAPRGGIVRGTVGIQTVEAKDAWAGATGAFALGGAIVLLFASFALAAGVFGTTPDTVAYFADKSFLIIFAFGAAIAVVCGAFGKLISMSVGR